MEQDVLRAELNMTILLAVAVLRKRVIVQHKTHALHSTALNYTLCPSCQHSALLYLSYPSQRLPQRQQFLLMLCSYPPMESKAVS